MTTYETSYERSARSYSDEDLIERARVIADAISILEAPVSLTAFSAYVFGIEPNPPATLWTQALEAVEQGEIRKLCIVAPPGHAKSTYHSIVFPAWYLGRHPNHSLIGVTTTDGLGKLYGDTVRSAIESNEKFGFVFPGVKPWTERGWAKDGFFIRGPEARREEEKDASMVYTGAGGPVIGRRANGVIVDDAVDEATARSETLLEARKIWVRRSVFSRLKPRIGWRIVCGTLWAEGDVVDEAMQSGEYVVIHVKAVSPSREVDADVWIPNGVKWRPREAVKVGEDDLASWTG